MLENCYLPSVGGSEPPLTQAHQNTKHTSNGAWPLQPFAKQGNTPHQDTATGRVIMLHPGASMTFETSGLLSSSGKRCLFGPVGKKMQDFGVHCLQANRAAHRPSAAGNH